MNKYKSKGEKIFDVIVLWFLTFVLGMIAGYTWCWFHLKGA